CRGGCMGRVRFAVPLSLSIVLLVGVLFGTARVGSGGPAPLPTSTPTPTATTTPIILDHFSCYEAHAPRQLVSGVSLVDAFGPSTVQLIEPHRFCAPADKNGEDTTAPMHDPHLEGFRMRQTSRFDRVRNIAVTNQFDSVIIDLVRPDYVLVPSSKS